MLSLAAAWACVLAAMSPALGMAAMPSPQPSHGVGDVPKVELALRVLAALLVAAAIMRGAEHLPPLVSGLLLAAPITGNVLPCFTLPRHGPHATAALLRGFLWGLCGFVAFFLTLYLALPWFTGAWAYALAWSAALGTALVSYGWRRRRVALA